MVMIERDFERKFYNDLAEELKPQGYRCFLYDQEFSTWLYVITPNNSLLYIDTGDYSGYNICFEYVPSEDFGTGCECNTTSLYEITKKDLDDAEEYGRSFAIFSKRYRTARKPKYFKDAFEGLKSRWCFDKLVEL